MDRDSNVHAELERARTDLGYAAGDKEQSLRKLHFWLKYEGLSSLLGFSAFFIPYRLTVAILLVVAGLFTPYLIWHLAKAEWYRAIALFAVFVGLPFIMSQLVPLGMDLGRFLLTMMPLVAFYIFNWILRLIIGEFLSDRQSIRELQYSRRNG